MKNYVVMTHYQLMYAVMHAHLYNKNNARLFISNDYINFDGINIDKILNKNIFIEANIFGTKSIQQDFFSALNSDNPKVAFDEVLENHFANIFTDCKGGTFYIFNEFQLYYYYIEKYANEIIIVEDGYGSYKQQNNILCFKGQYKEINPYIGTLFPLLHAKSPKVVKYLINVPVNELSVHKGLIEICDFKEMESKINRNSLLNFYKDIYNFPDKLNENSALLLTQPLKRANYCRTIDQMKLYKKILKEKLSQFDHIYIKPHPADDIGYNFLVNEKVTLLSSDFPVEVFNYTETEFELTYTFGSTASKIAKYSKDNISLFNYQKPTHNQIARFIKKFVRGVKIEILQVVEIDDNFNFEKDEFLKFKMPKNNSDFTYKTIILNNSSQQINFKHKVYTDCSKYDIINNHTYNYVFFVKNKLAINQEIIRELSYYFRNFYADTISTISTFIIKHEGVYHRVAMDKKSLLYTDYDVIFAAGIIKEENYRNHSGLFHSINTSVSVDIVEYFTTTNYEEKFTLLIENICSESPQDEEELLFQLTMIKLAMIKKIHIKNFNLNNKILLKILENNTFTNDNTLYKLKLIKTTYIALYYKLRVEKVIRIVRNSFVEETYLRLKDKIVKQ